MELKLHVFLESDSDGIVMQGWEFTDVVVSGKTFDQAKDKFIQAVKTSLKADILVACDMLKNAMNESNFPLNTTFLKVLQIYNECLIKYENDDVMTFTSNKILLEVLDEHLKVIKSKPLEYTPNGEKKEIVITEYV
ncbi:MAG: hypothetical protein K8823_1252 [Cenarchaeum symbiont of Oopsacas minuta]|nr:hypothetical protein [Cenarchaeum symbiont of Oopsacas minuta]